MMPNRDDVGPFLILGIDKDADASAIDAAWSRQSRAAQRSELSWQQADLDWARATLADPERRVAADVESADADIVSGEVRRLARLYHVDGAPPGWEPMDPEPPVELPGAEPLEPAAAVAAVVPPEAPLELPAINRWLEEFAAASLDPWSIDLSGG